MNNKFDKAPSRKAEFGADDASMASDRFFSPLLLSLHSFRISNTLLNYILKALPTARRVTRTTGASLFESTDGSPTKTTYGRPESVV